MTLKACIIGLGKVGLQFDLEEKRRADPTQVWTHFSAYERLKDRYEIVAVVDPSESARKIAAERKPSAKVFSTTDEWLTSGVTADVVSICVPDSEHLPVLEKVIPVCRGIFLEKPIFPVLGAPVELSSRMAKCFNLIRDRKIAAYVNYYKRRDPTILRMIAEIAKGSEKIRYAQVNYSGPFEAVGSHALDLLVYVGGASTVASSVRHEHVEGAGYSAQLVGEVAGEKTKLSLNYTGSRTEFVFEMDVMTDRSRYRITDNLSNFSRAEFAASPRYQGYREYQTPSAQERMENQNRFTDFLSSIYEEVASGKPSYREFEIATLTQDFMGSITTGAKK